ncbi:MAG: DUF2797 domain-containing protein [Pseudomonadales bacterium]|nr:DUF2797 domain-containing protein [Pseudomonadales bacterium]
MIGTLRKLKTELTSPVTYHLPIGEELKGLNERIGSHLTLTHTGNIFCIHCNRKTKKSFSQGYCYPCFKKLAQCDTCIVKPETCHFDQGTCREPDWAQSHCFQPHYVYLANSSGIKVGITRENQIPTRWMDQGAIQALPIAKVTNRHLSGLIEISIAQHVADKTNWRTMLKGAVTPIDLQAQQSELLAMCDEKLAGLKERFGAESIEILRAEPVEINYPVETYPTKVSSHNFDKNAHVSGVLKGIKGQYLMFDTGVINIRKFAGYEIEWAE